MTPELSVVICSFNMRPTLGAQLEALLSQDTQREFEVVVVDNGSTDGTDELVERFSAADARVRLVVNPVRGLNVSRNVGVEASTADLIAMCDADDIVEPGWIDAMAEAGDGQTFSAGAIRRGGNNDQRTQVRWAASPSAVVEAPRHHGHLTAVGCNCAFPKAMWTALGGFDERLSGAGDETEFFRRASEAGYALKEVPEAIVQYRLPDHASDVVRRGWRYGFASERLIDLEGIERRGFVSRRWKYWLRLTVSVPLGIVRARGRYHWLHRGADAGGEIWYRLKALRPG